ncbi:isopeptide-forming domain-containing fimbrial protein [Faecalicatena contorta]|uniref:isopeptide-forming domain-containing fimbrial protein n=1 Tax=Faecalicatena contorta TaxID=39482 RepID=UPI001F2B62B3|nr:isopeptide-forming domain-containing fimbrial protein [Faecalicatena contorta]MCF2680622.1 isopeptide-forming domain-containing fimbrial protein [Faecalicatena contorta]
MKKFKKVFAVLLTLAMVLGMSMTTFAANKPTASDKKTASVTNIEAGATVTAYQIVEAKYNDAGFIGYSAVNGVTIKNPLAPTSDEVTTIAQNVNGLKSVQMTTTTTSGLATYTADLNAGYWIVLVRGTVEEVYNPMLVGVYYSKSGSDNTMSSDAVDANSNWELVTSNAYAKSTKPTVDKKIVNSDGNDNGNSVAIGDTVNFEIDTAIPSYSKEYTTVLVQVKDELSEGLTLKADSVTVDGLTKGTDYTITTSDRGFVITINSAYALANGGKDIKVTYSATVNGSAKFNFDPNTNKATFIYTNNPEGTTKEVYDKTYSYTFGIDAKLNGSSTEIWNKITQELVKGEMVKETVEGEEKEVFKPLTGAKFSLTNKSTNKVYTATSTDGALTFTGLDAGEYTLKETEAPEGYTVNDKEIPVVITAEYNTDGTLKAYTITVDGKATSTYTATYTGESIEKTITNIVEGEGNATTQIKNTKIASLPGTGGIGTTIFTIGGCLIMIIAAALFFANRRKAK